MQEGRHGTKYQAHFMMLCMNDGTVHLKIPLFLKIITISAT